MKATTQAASGSCSNKVMKPIPTIAIAAVTAMDTPHEMLSFINYTISKRYRDVKELYTTMWIALSLRCDMIIAMEKKDEKDLPTPFFTRLYTEEWKMVEFLLNEPDINSKADLARLAFRNLYKSRMKRKQKIS